MRWTGVIEKVWSPAVKTATNLTVFLVLIIPLIWMGFANMAQSLQGMYFIFSGDNELTLSNEKDVEQVSTYLTQHLTANQSVAASPQILWKLPGEKVNFPFMVVYDQKSGTGTQLIPVSKEQFAYSSSFQDLSYIVLDPLAKDFSIRVYSDLAEIFQEVERWPMVYQSGDLQVYRNPHTQSGSSK
jgi:hypothetical protein